MIFVADSASPKLITHLEEIDVVHQLPKVDALYDGIRNHPDLLLSPVDHQLFLSIEVTPHIHKHLEAGHIPYTVINKPLGHMYPMTASLNVISSDNYIICNKNTVAPELLEYALSSNKRIIHVNQGYVRCTTLPLGNDTFITDDPGIAKTLAQENLNVIKVTEGHINLPSHPHGFIGGCAGKIGQVVYFNGDVSKHPDYKTIEKACSTLNLTISYTTDIPLTDVGGVIQKIKDGHGVHGEMTTADTAGLD